MSAETLAVLRLHADRELPLDSIRAIGSLALSGDVASNVFELGGHISTLSEFACAVQAGAWSVNGVGASSDAALREAEATLTRAIQDLESPGLAASEVGAGGLLVIFMQLLPLILELIKKRKS